METCFEYLTDDKYGTFCSDEKKWVRQIKELHAQYPDQVKIISDQNGSIMAHLPKSWFKVKPPVKRNLTEEQRKLLTGCDYYASSRSLHLENNQI